MFLWVILHRPALAIAYPSVFVINCAVISLAYLALFMRFVNRRFAIIESLNDNGYGIYLIHYLFVVWQYELLGVNLPAIAKGLIVFASVLVLSWGAVASMRRIPAVAKII